MLTGGVLQILSCGLTPLLRNDNRAVSAMMIMVGGLFANLVLILFLCMFFIWGLAVQQVLRCVRSCLRLCAA